MIFLPFNYRLHIAAEKKAHLYPIVCSCNDYNAHFTFPCSLPMFSVPQSSIQHISTFEYSWIRMKRKNFHEHIFSWCSYDVLRRRRWWQTNFLFFSQHLRLTFPLHLHECLSANKKAVNLLVIIFLFLAEFNAAHSLCKLSEICWILGIFWRFCKSLQQKKTLELVWNWKSNLNLINLCSRNDLWSIDFLISFNLWSISESNFYRITNWNRN